MGGEELFERGRAAWRSGRFFEAHERWEDAWRQASDPAFVDALQGLIQLAASLHKASRNEEKGHAKLWAKGAARLSRAAPRLPVLHDLDVMALASSLTSEPPSPDQPPSLDEARPEFGVVYLHGFGSSPDSPKARAIQSALKDHGIPVAAPRLAEPNEFFDFTVSRSLGRARHALFSRTLLVGSSLGGWTGTLLATTEPRVRELVLLCPAFYFSERWLEPARQVELEAWRREGCLDFEVGHPASRQALGVGFLEDALGHEGGVQPPVPTIAFHGRRDEVVPLSDVERVLAGVDLAELRVVNDDHGLRDHLEQIAACVVERALALQAQDAESGS
ncbi:MAG: YqiA/YcfP family alpha/beta fold hydrolase [Myxococcota bacterium]